MRRDRRDTLAFSCEGLVESETKFHKTLRFLCSARGSYGRELNDRVLSPRARRSGAIKAFERWGKNESVALQIEALIGSLDDTLSDEVFLSELRAMGIYRGRNLVKPAGRAYLSSSEELS